MQTAPGMNFIKCPWKCSIQEPFWAVANRQVNRQFQAAFTFFIKIILGLVKSSLSRKSRIRDFIQCNRPENSTKLVDFSLCRAITLYHLLTAKYFEGLCFSVYLSLPQITPPILPTIDISYILQGRPVCPIL